MKWPLILVFGFLGLGIGANLCLAFSAMHDPGLVVEAHYYDHAMAWDARQEQARQNRLLGWNITILHTQPLCVSLTDRNGVPIPSATVRGEGYAMTGLESPAFFDMQHVSGGIYGSAFALHHPGIWHLDITVHDKGRTFTASLKTEVE